MVVGGRRLRLDLFDLFLIAEFTFISVRYYLPISNGTWMDSSAYWDAAHRWLSGADPYASSLGDLAFAAPPPTLAALALFALLPQPVFAWGMLVGSVIAAVFLLQRLKLPAWYLLFPPIVEGVMVGNPNIIVTALLVAAIPAGDAIATFLKIYAIIPMGLLLRRRSIVWTIAALVVTAPFLPWISYFNHAAELATILNVQSSGGRSALALPILIPFTVAALVLVGRKRAAWLAVPALWPSTQFHYSVLALPASGRLMAAILAIPVPGAPAVAVIVEAATVYLRRRSRGGVPNTEREAREAVAP